jgi:hypothetical protein
MGVLLPEREAAELMGVTPRSLRRRASEYATAPAPEKSANGRAARMYDLATLPPEANLRWGALERRKVIDIESATPGQMALELTTPVGPNLSPDDRAEAEHRYGVIEALIRPERYPDVWAMYKTKLRIVEYLAQKHKLGERTIYRWLKAFKQSGIPGLVSRDRADKGIPKALNTAALDWLVTAAAPKQGAYGEYTVAELHRAYRNAHIGKRLGEFEQRKYARYLDADGRLSRAAAFEPVAYETVRTWYERLPDIVKVMARDGQEAYANTQEIISYRDLTSIKPLDYVVMDHRRLDLFCLIPCGSAG